MLYILESRWLWKLPDASHGFFTSWCDHLVVMEKSTVSDTPDGDVVQTKGFETGAESPSQSTLLDNLKLPKWQLISLCIRYIHLQIIFNSY